MFIDAMAETQAALSAFGGISSSLATDGLFDSLAHSMSPVVTAINEINSGPKNIMGAMRANNDNQSPVFKVHTSPRNNMPVSPGCHRWAVHPSRLSDHKRCLSHGTARPFTVSQYVYTRIALVLVDIAGIEPALSTEAQVSQLYTCDTTPYYGIPGHRRCASKTLHVHDRVRRESNLRFFRRTYVKRTSVIRHTRILSIPLVQGSVCTI